MRRREVVDLTGDTDSDLDVQVERHQNNIQSMYDEANRINEEYRQRVVAARLREEKKKRNADPRNTLD